MKNLWESRSKTGMARWDADLAVLRHDLERLQAWTSAVVDLGEACEVFTVHEAPLIGYRRERDGPLRLFLENLYRTRGFVDLFYFASSGFAPVEGSHFRCSARLSYFDRDGNPAEAEAEDLADLLRAVAPERGRIRHAFPLESHGPRIGIQNPRDSTHFPPSGRVRVSFEINTDIWFPWVNAVDVENLRSRRAARRKAIQEKHPDTRIGIIALRYRNPLAQLHTPRLNKFLSGVHHLTTQLGGRWERNLDPNFTRSDYLLMTDADGIQLDAPVPKGFLEEEP